MKKVLLTITVLFATSAFANSEYLVKLDQGTDPSMIANQLGDVEIEDIGFNNWYKVTTHNQRSLSLRNLPFARAVEKNGVLKYALHQPKAKRDGNNPFPFPGDGGDGNNPFPFPGDGGDGNNPFPFPGDGGDGNNPFPFPGDGGDGGGIGDIIGGGGSGGASSKDPDFPKNITVTTGADPSYSKQWGMADIGVKDAWSVTKGEPAIIVGVIDTGIDYTHEDLAQNIWRNPGETGTDSNGKDKASNGIDDDGNGYIDDVVGWDFATDDNKPYDTTGGSPFFGGNPGHGTHCAGNIAAGAENGKGIIGVAPNVKLMALRFLTEKGSGDIAGAVKAIKYGVDNGARILSNSWGSEGDDGDGQVLKEVIQYAMDHGVLFVAAAGNGHNGVGYNNDTDPKPGYPASYDIANIVSVAALNQSNKLTSFSNWGKNTVDLGAPGATIFSSIPANKYMNLDGTSMACPIVAGAAALYLSKHPEAGVMEVKDALIKSVTPISALNGKSVSGGKLNVKNLVEL